MSAGQRAFAQKLPKQHAADVRRQIAAASYNRDMCKSISSSSSFQSSIPLCDVVEPLDYEEFVQQHQLLIDRDPLRHILQFPADDLEVGIIPRKFRTQTPIVPEEPLSQLNGHVRDCVRSYTSDWLVYNRCYQQYSSSCWVHDKGDDRLAMFQTSPRQEFEIDTEETEEADSSPDIDSDRESVHTGSSRQSLHMMDTPRGSWASFDLRNSQSDSLLPSLLDRVAADTIDQLNETRRAENRQESLFNLYPPQEEDEIVERRMLSEIPSEHQGHRILVKCQNLKLDLEIEPVFASMALYDAKEKKKISENFYFDMNSEPLKRMLGSHVPYQDVSTLSRSCIFDVSYPSTDLFLVVKLEKVLQGDISDCAEPYMKDEKNWNKVKANAVACCDRLGKYRMPFAWTAIYLVNIVNGVNSLDRDSGSDKETAASNSLDRKLSTSSFDQFRKKAGDTNSLTRRGSLERRSMSEKRRSWSPEDFGASLDLFRPLTLTVSSFFKQEGDKLRDEDLYKFLQDLKRPSSALKRLKCIPGILKLDISPCPDEPKYCLTSELVRLNPYPDEKGRPTKEVIEFPPREVFVPHYTYRNLLYVSPKELNFANRPGSARNITVKVQFMAGEDESQALTNIYGKSSSPEFAHEAYTTVNYHNKSPAFYDEVKVKLPANLGDNHHLLFTFYHISCQKKLEQTVVETPVGYTWLPILKDGRLQTGEYCLPVMLEPPPSNYSYITPDVMLPGTKWVDGHKGIFTVDLLGVSSTHTQDKYLDKFFALCACLEDGKLPPRVGEANVEGELKGSVQDLGHAKAEPLVKFLPMVLSKLLSLLAQPPDICGHPMNLGQSIFEAIAVSVKNVTALQEGQLDQHGRALLLTSYISFQCTLPPAPTAPSQQDPPAPTPRHHHHPPHHPTHPPPPPPPPPPAPGFSSPPPHHPLSVSPTGRRPHHPRSTSNPDVHNMGAALVGGVDQEVAAAFERTLDRAASMRTTLITDQYSYGLLKAPAQKLVHEELALQWVVSSGSAKELAMHNSWFFFELMVKSMVEHLAAMQQLDSPRKHRFPEHFMDDIGTLVTTHTSDIISRYNKDVRCIQGLNNSLAFFFHDLMSVMDRGYVFSLIKTYCKQLSAKIASLPDAAQLVSLKLDFMRIVCSHEHFVALNLPFGTPLTPSSAPASPSPSVASSTSQSSFISTLIGGGGGDRNCYAELSFEFRQQHFLVGLVLGDLATVLETNHPQVHAKAVNTVRNLMSCHDCDPRYAEPEGKARVATLYLPLIGIVLDALPQLHDWFPDNRSRPLLTPGQDELEHHHVSINQSVAMAIAGTSMFGSRSSTVESHDHFHQSRKSPLSAETTRNLLTCFLWVVKNVDKSVLRQWWSDMPALRLHQLLELLYICITCFEYKGKQAIRRCAQQNFIKTCDMKSRLEDVILGQGSARSEMMMRRKERHPPSPSPHGDRLRWRKDQLSWRHSTEPTERPKAEIEMDAHIDGNLATEANMTILDTLELIIQVVSSLDLLQGLLSVVLRVLLHALSRNQSTYVLQNMFATQRSLVFKFPSLLFDEETEQCADLCLRLLKHCSSCISIVRSQASASLYLLMRQNFETGNNFARVKMQVTMSLSSLVGTSQTFNEESLRRSLKTILVYAEEDSELQDTTFPEQVRDLVFNLHMILSDTVKMKEFQEDPEMLLDLMYRIAKGYQNSPDLRLTWLANMAQKHTERNNHAEAAMCLVHSASLVTEYLHMLEDRPYLPTGAVSFEGLSPNALEESAVSDDVVSPDQEGICTGKYFTENGLLGLLEHAASSFNIAGMYEAMNEVYKILVPIAESNRDYKKLANIHSKLHDAFTRIDQLHGKRVFGTYFRVGFYGNKFGDLDGEEFVYKEPTLTKLPEISSRLESFYAERFGPENVAIIKDSNMVDPAKLDPEMAYIQITYVEPYFDPYEYRERLTYFDKNYNIKRFIYATPFTPDGRAHGELHEQHKRKTIVTTSSHFPYVKTRIQVVGKKMVVLTPIEVAIEDIQKKTVELAVATQQEPPDPKILQMVLQGCIGTTVNQGPMEVALVFLSDLLDGQTMPSKHQNKLRLCFKDFSKRCADALRRNKTLIGPDQRDYQRELERNYHRFTDRLMPMITITNIGRLTRSRSSGSQLSSACSSLRSSKTSPIA